MITLQRKRKKYPIDMHVMVCNFFIVGDIGVRINTIHVKVGQTHQFMTTKSILRLYVRVLAKYHSKLIRNVCNDVAKKAVIAIAIPAIQEYLSK